MSLANQAQQAYTEKEFKEGVRRAGMGHGYARLHIFIPVWGDFFLTFCKHKHALREQAMRQQLS
jgi:hypothetical protein